MFKVFSGEEMGNLHMLILQRLAGKGMGHSGWRKAGSSRNNPAQRNNRFKLSRVPERIDFQSESP
jgi:hypothetical protein